jgi:flagellar secretion chaperone FliS
VNPYAKTGAYTESAVLTAPPGRLVVMLYDGAIRFLSQSATAMRMGDRERSRDRMRRAEAIIDELLLSLDLSYGELPLRLRSIYLFCKRELHEANVSTEADRLDRVGRLLAELRESWDQLASQDERKIA